MFFSMAVYYCTILIASRAIQKRVNSMVSDTFIELEMLTCLPEISLAQQELKRHNRTSKRSKLNKHYSTVWSLSTSDDTIQVKF